MEGSFLFQGLLIGISIAAPVGPIGLLCISRTLNQGRWFGFISGLGAATADAVYGSVAGFGLNAVSHWLIRESGWIRMLGGVFLVYLGIRGWLAKPADVAANAKGGGMLWSYASTFMLTITNPMTILSFVAVFAVLGVAQVGQGLTRAVLIVVGVFLGSLVWWFFLSTLTELLRAKLSPRVLGWIGRGSALVILTFGIHALW